MQTRKHTAWKKNQKFGDVMGGRSKKNSWTDVVRADKQLNNAESIKRLVGPTMEKRNIAIKHSDDKYSFTKA